MSEVGEVPIPQETKDIPPLSPEVAEKRQAMYERIQAESADPVAVVSRTVNEMGFFEGLMKVTEPYRKEKMHIMWKNFKAKTSLVLSLIPVLGQGKALLGVVKEGGKFKYFEPAIRASAAAKRGKEAFTGAMKAAHKTDTLFGKVKNLKPVRAVVGSFRGVGATYGTFGKFAAEEAAASLKHLENTNKLFGAKQAAARAKEIEFIAQRASRLSGTKYENGAKWFDLIGKFKLWRVDLAAKKATKGVMKTHEATQAIKNVLNSEVKASNKASQWIGERAAHAKSAVDVGLKKKKFMVVFDEIFNLTPDVPQWLSLTTAIGETVGMHGADAISATTQLGIDYLKDAKLSVNMAKDVWGYTTKRLLGPRDVPKAAVEVYAAANSARAAGMA